MRNLKKALHCRPRFRCGLHYSCEYCGIGWRIRHLNGFMHCLETLHESQPQHDIPMYYVVIGSNKFGTLDCKLSDFTLLLKEVSNLKKRGKLGVFFGRLEVSFKSAKWGLYPHLNLLVWGDYSKFETLAKTLGLTFWYNKKKNNLDTAKNIAYYMLKFNPIGIERGEAVRKAHNGRTTIIRSREFNFKSSDYTDEIIHTDFSFFGVYPIRSKKGILWREIKRRINKYLNAKIKEADRDFS